MDASVVLSEAQVLTTIAIGSLDDCHCVYRKAKPPDGCNVQTQGLKDLGEHWDLVALAALRSGRCEMNGQALVGSKYQ